MKSHALGWLAGSRRMLLHTATSSGGCHGRHLESVTSNPTMSVDAYLLEEQNVTSYVRLHVSMCKGRLHQPNLNLSTT